jgi:hypothetical protein
MGGAWTTSTSPNVRKQIQNTISAYIQPFKALTSGGGCYIDEGDCMEENWKQTFFGEQYDTLLAVKKRYDPTAVFNCWKCVGGRDTMSKLLRSHVTNESSSVIARCILVTPRVAKRHAHLCRLTQLDEQVKYISRLDLTFFGVLSSKSHRDALLHTSYFLPHGVITLHSRLQLISRYSLPTSSLPLPCNVKCSPDKFTEPPRNLQSLLYG